MKKKWLAVVPAIALFAAPFAASAEAHTTNIKATTENVTNTILYEGILSHSKEVQTLQETLTRVGYPTVVSGEFEAGTKQAVEVFQASHGLKVDGIVDEETWNMLAQDEATIDYSFTKEQAISYAKAKFGEGFVFSSDWKPKADQDGQTYYRVHVASQEFIDEGGTGTVGFYYVYKDGRVIEEQ